MILTGNVWLCRGRILCLKNQISSLIFFSSPQFSYTCYISFNFFSFFPSYSLIYEAFFLFLYPSHITVYHLPLLFLFSSTISLFFFYLFFFFFIFYLIFCNLLPTKSLLLEGTIIPPSLHSLILSSLLW